MEWVNQENLPIECQSLRPNWELCFRDEKYKGAIQFSANLWQNSEPHVLKKLPAVRENPEGVRDTAYINQITFEKRKN